MKKMIKTSKPRALHLDRQTIRTLEAATLTNAAGGQPRLRTITCDDECDSYACMDTYC